MLDCRFRPALPPLGRVCFSDRTSEVEELQRLLERGTAAPLLLYGPEGSGKSTLLRYMVWRVNNAGGLGVYIDALSGAELEEAVYPLTAAVRSIVAELAPQPPLGRVLAMRLWELLKGLIQRLEVRGRPVLVVVDDVYRALGLEAAEAYTKRLYELLGRLYELGAGPTLVVAATSEGVSKRLLQRHSYASLRMVWNLPRSGLEELLAQTGAPIAPEEAWRTTGGNPRLLGRLAEHIWRPRPLLAELAEQRLAPALDRIGREALESLVKDPDSDPEAAKVLEEHNLMMELARSTSLTPPPPADREMGIGRRWAWQAPAYRLAAKLLLEEP